MFESEDEEDEAETVRAPWEVDFTVRIVPDLDLSAYPPMRVRKISPTECERLQGFPDGWTIATPEMEKLYGLSVSTLLDGTSSEGRSRFRSQSGSARVSAP